MLKSSSGALSVLTQPTFLGPVQVHSGYQLQGIGTNSTARLQQWLAFFLGEKDATLLIPLMRHPKLGSQQEDLPTTMPFVRPDEREEKQAEPAPQRSQLPAAR